MAFMNRYRFGWLNGLALTWRTSVGLVRCAGVVALAGLTSAHAVWADASEPQQGKPHFDELSPPVGYALVWSDEFSEEGLPDQSRWIYDTSLNKAGWHNNEKQYYSHARIDNAHVRDGSLTITARREALASESDWGGQQYTSARLLSKERWTYGFFEIRARLPCGKGTWPAIWMLGDGGTWPENGELDIMEHVGKDPTRVFSTVHTIAGNGANGTGAATVVADACSEFHNYQMLWTPTEVTFGIDGKPHFVYRNSGTGNAEWPFDKPEFLILNIAVGGYLGGEVDNSIFPRAMAVDYVRVYQPVK